VKLNVLILLVGVKLVMLTLLQLEDLFKDLLVDSFFGFLLVLK